MDGGASTEDEEHEEDDLMCRAVKVLCLAEDADALLALKRAAVGAAWELTPGATTTDEALVQIEQSRPHILVVSGSFGETVGVIKERSPQVRVVADFAAEGVDVQVGSLDEIRDAIIGAPRPGGPVRASGANDEVPQD